MPWTSPVDPVAGSVITVAWEVANALNPIRWLRLMTGNADPPGSGYVVVSDSATATHWDKVGSDAMAPGAAVGNLGYTPVNKGGDSGIGNLTSVGTVSAATVHGDTVNATAYSGGSGVVGGTVTVQGLATGSSGISCNGPIVAVGAIVGQNGIQAANFSGGSTTAGGTVNVQGLATGPSGVASGGPVTCTSVSPTVSYGGGTTTAGAPSMLGLTVGANGIGTSGLIQSTRVAGAPLAVASQVQVVNLHADLLDGAHASASPVGNAIPIADASGKLDAWVTPSGAASIPSGAVCGYDAAIAGLPSGWTRFSAADGRILVGDGTLFSQTFLAGASYGAAWGHAHATTWASHTHSGAALSVGGTTGGPSATGGTTSGTPPPAFGTDTHTHSSGSLDVGGNTDAAGGGGSSTDTWLPPMRGVYWIKKT